MKNELHGEYRKDFNIIQKYIKREVIDCEERTSVIEDLYELYEVSQNEGLAISQIHEGKAEDYVFEIIGSLPKKTPAYKTKRIIVFVSLIFVFLLLFFLARPENLTKNQGFYYVSKNPDKYDFGLSGTSFSDVWEFKIDGNIFSIVEESKSKPYKNLHINDFFMSEDGETIYMSGKTEALYQNKTSGKIAIPTFKLVTYYDVSAALDSMLNYNPDNYVSFSDEPNQILFGNTIYNGKITKYKFNIDGSVNFEIAFTKSYEKEVEIDSKNYIYWNCFFFEWVMKY